MYTVRRILCREQVRRFDVRFIMKADDDAFVNVPALIAELKANCVTPGCRRERMYFGREIRNNVVSLPFRHLNCVRVVYSRVPMRGAHT
jgi:hypothetical protein